MICSFPFSSKQCQEVQEPAGTKGFPKTRNPTGILIKIEVHIFQETLIKVELYPCNKLWTGLKRCKVKGPVHPR